MTEHHARLMKSIAARVDGAADPSMLDVYHTLLGEALRALRALSRTINVQQEVINREPSKLAAEAALALLIAVDHVVKHHDPTGECFESVKTAASTLDAAMGYPLLAFGHGSDDLHT